MDSQALAEALRVLAFCHASTINNRTLENSSKMDSQTLAEALSSFGFLSCKCNK